MNNSSKGISLNFPVFISKNIKYFHNTSTFTKSKCLNKRTRVLNETPSGKCLNFALKFTLFTNRLLFREKSRKDKFKSRKGKFNVLIRKK